MTPEESENIFFLCFVFFGFLKVFFCFFHGVTPEESVDFVSMGPSPKCLKILYCYDVMTIYEEDKNEILKIRILCCK